MKTSNTKRVDPPFSVSKFFLTVGITLVVYGVLLRIFAPGTFRANIDASSWRYMGVIVSTKLFVCSLAEWIFHRYILHKPTIWFLKPFYYKHNTHHGLTPVKGSLVEMGVIEVEVDYAIEKMVQHRASFFPFYTLGAFLTVFLLVTVPLQILLPGWPIMIGVPVAMTLSLVLYELVHAVEHWPFETFWEPKLKHPRFGRLWTTIYGFHWRHHALVKFNETISGFFLLPIWDWIFRTYVRTSRIFKDGERVSVDEFKGTLPRPVWLIQKLDQLTDWLASKQGYNPEASM